MIRTKRKPPYEQNGELREMREWWKWLKTTSRISWLAVGGLVVIIGGCGGVLAIIRTLIELWRMFQ